MEKGNRKLYRSNKDFILSGVCGGLAEYFEIDSTLVRLIFVLLSLGGGGGIIIYIIMSLIIPKEGVKTKELTKNVEDKKGRHIFIGILLVFIGLIFLFNRLMPIGWMRWDLFWPLIMVGIGLFIIVK